jgi:D-tyrosyl-tRNA(Tyr) deacylase
MRALVQRVGRASVTIQSGPGEGEVTGSIGRGLLALVGVTHDDGPAQAKALAAKIWHLRVFEGSDGPAAGRMDLPVAEVGGEVLVVSQFTLYGDTRKGRRPSWVQAAGPEHAEPLCDLVCDELRALGATVATGRFRADMAVELVNDGPVTLLLEV